VLTATLGFGRLGPAAHAFTRATETKRNWGVGGAKGGNSNPSRANCQIPLL
jgi:hypothetical protein